MLQSPTQHRFSALGSGSRPRTKGDLQLRRRFRADRRGRRRTRGRCWPGQMPCCAAGCVTDMRWPPWKQPNDGAPSELRGIALLEALPSGFPPSHRISTRCKHTMNTHGVLNPQLRFTREPFQVQGGHRDHQRWILESTGRPSFFSQHRRSVMEAALFEGRTKVSPQSADPSSELPAAPQSSSLPRNVVLLGKRDGSETWDATELTRFLHLDRSDRSPRSSLS